MTDDRIDRAVEEIRKHCTDQGNRFAERLSQGNETFARHEERINYLEGKYDRICHKIDGMNARVTAIMGGVIVACILLAINLVLDKL